MSDQKPREFWIEFSGGPENDHVVHHRRMATEKFEPIDFNDEVIHVIEKSAYIVSEQARAALDIQCKQLRTDLSLAIEALSDISSWLHRMSDLKWNDKSYAPKFKAAYIRMTETLAKLKETK